MQNNNHRYVLTQDMIITLGADIIGQNMIITVFIGQHDFLKLPDSGLLWWLFLSGL